MQIVEFHLDNTMGFCQTSTSIIITYSKVEFNIYLTYIRHVSLSIVIILSH